MVWRQEQIHGAEVGEVEENTLHKSGVEKHWRGGWRDDADCCLENTSRID